VAGGEGYLSVAQQVDADHYTDMGKFPTALGTRTGVWYVKRDRLYLAAPPERRPRRPPAGIRGAIRMSCLHALGHHVDRLVEDHARASTDYYSTAPSNRLGDIYHESK
jgi:hypothetical protein